VVYDDGVPRPVTSSSIGLVAYSNSPEVIYADSGNHFSKLTVGSCGAAVAMEISSLVTSNSRNLKYDNGRIYSGGGRVIDPEAVVIAGTFFVPTIGVSVVETDSKANRIYSLNIQGTTATVRVFDMQTFALVGILSIPGLSGVPQFWDDPPKLIRWGTNGLAFNTPTNVYLLQHPLIAGPSGSFTPAPTASPSTFTVNGTVMALSTPVSDVTITFSGLQAGSIQTDALGKYSIPNLPLCGTLTITPSKPNYTFTPSSITLTNPRNQSANFDAFHRIIGFVQSQVTVSEGSSKVFLAIARSAGLPPTTTDVDYSTSSGTASERSDFTGALGTFHFDTVTAQASFEVLLTDDALVEGSETFTATLQPVPGFDLVNPTVTVTIIDNDSTPPTTNPIDGPSLFVRQHYHDFLNRDPDPLGFAFWQNQITSCGADLQCVEVKSINVSAAFFLAIEFQETGYLVYRMHKTAFGNLTGAPVPVAINQFLKDTQAIGRNIQVGIGDWQTQLENNKQAFALAFVQRPEFLAAYPTTLSADQFVTKLDTNAGGVLSAAEKTSLVGLLGATPEDATKRAQVLRAVAEDQDLRTAEFNKAFVLMQYFGYLRRNPNDLPDSDFSGFGFWLNKLNSFGGNFVQAEMVKAFLSSIEYRQRFGP